MPILFWLMELYKVKKGLDQEQNPEEHQSLDHMNQTKQYQF